MEEKPKQTAADETGALDEQIDSLLSGDSDTAAPDDATAPTLNEQLDVMMSADQTQQMDPQRAVSADGAGTAADTARAESELAGDDLAKQIQELLDTAKETADGSSPKPAGTATTAMMSDATNTSTETSGESAETEAVVQKIDEVLAENADDAIADDFETVAQVTGQTTDVDQLNATEAPQWQERSADTEEAEPDLEGAFASPEDLLNSEAAMPAATASFSATAASVARELDEQPEKHSKPVKAPKPPKVSKPRDPNAPSLLRRVLMIVNAPLLHASKPVRDGVGWVALLTIFNGSMLLMARTVFHVTGEPNPNAPLVEDHGAGGGGHGEKTEAGESSGHGETDSHGAKSKVKPKSTPKAPVRKVARKSAKAETGEHADAGGH